MIRNVLPIMREQKSGHIFNVSSLGAYNVGSLAGAYCATKYAIKAFSKTLAMEVKPFGIKVTDVKPGFMRTDFLSSSQKETLPENSPYKNITDKTVDFYSSENGNQIGDPKLVAKLYIKTFKMENPPESLIMGSDSYEGIETILKQELEELKDLKELSSETDYKEG